MQQNHHALPQRPAWQHLPAIPKTTALIQDLVRRLHDQQIFERALATSAQRIESGKYVLWVAHSVASGYSGMAILDAYLDECFPDQGSDLAGSHYLQCALNSFVGSPVSEGLFAGTSGLAFAATLLSRNGTRYGRLIESLDQGGLPLMAGKIEQMSATPHGPAPWLYDTISGLTGAGAYLLLRTHEMECRAMLHQIGTAFIALSGDEDGIPHWYVPQAMIMQKHFQPLYPDGLLDSGLAHGIAGPLALLALMYRQGEIVPGHAQAMERIADWLIARRCDDEWGINWGNVYPIRGSGPPPQPTHAAWCYGAPGVARALWLAGDALAHAGYKQIATDAMTAVCRRPPEARKIQMSNLCHGTAGLLMIMLRFWNDTQMPIFEATAGELLAQLIDNYDPDSILGYRDIAEGQVLVDRPDLLTGSIGITLALLAATCDAEPTWHRLFLIA